jgi:hypothetical protein
MVTKELSQKNKYWISKHRQYELKHFCLQYPTWKQEYAELSYISASVSARTRSSNTPSDPTGNLAVKRSYYKERIDLIERIAMETDEGLWVYILRGVTEGLSYNHLKSRLKIPCGRDVYYACYRRFFWLLSRARQ